MTTLTFALPDGTTETVAVTRLLNAGYAGRDQAEVRAHIEELAELGVPGPDTIPTMYPIAPYLAQQTDVVEVQHGKTSGEAEWALIITESGVLLSAACDHTDRNLEVHGVAWSKNASPDVIATSAWRLDDVRDHLDDITLKAWVGQDRRLIQDGTLGALLDPDHWLGVLAERGLDTPGTVLVSGTITMKPGVDQFADRWEVELGDPTTGATIGLAYAVAPLPEPIG
ncbi:hypothetical protein GCM10011512_21130 [Tersicoccus solisilvae]|uniref:DUF2848 domain-containing protein n=1 Tax=Tersicoccus solisilvae TaxID=1882339 RepID=A0ABQ1PAN5_9MICC|nr:DUF2848 domain-containing protein [Tersicoccus solisilvae]GGC93878.1 hypothetical protein GCM10011512_21130 [Tersicoccus solisilvae]